MSSLIKTGLIWGTKKLTNNWIRIHNIIAFINSNYMAKYTENSRETFGKEATETKIDKFKSAPYFQVHYRYQVMA